MSTPTPSQAAPSNSPPRKAIPTATPTPKPRPKSTTTRSNHNPVLKDGINQAGLQVPAQPSNTDANTHDKKIKRHTSQPIITWFQRKIAGNKHVARKRQAKELSLTSNSNAHPNTSATAPKDSLNGRARTPKHSRRPSSLHITSTEPQRLEVQISNVDGADDERDGQARRRLSAPPSLHSLDMSLRPGSTWSMRDPGEADDDASIRPLPPSSPPSPVPSRSTHQSSTTSGGYSSDLRTARSIGAPSTKPTTLMSIDLGPGGHIAQPPNNGLTGGRYYAGPPTPNASPIVARFPLLRVSTTLPSLSTAISTSSAMSLSRSRSGGRPSTSVDTTSSSLTIPSANANHTSGSDKLTAQAPGHTLFHPRNNPRPASPPLDNASTLTLASSNFAVSVASPRSRSIAGVERDGDTGASMRALRPSSRRGSWGSDETGWSVAGQSTNTGISTGGPALIGMYATASGQQRRRGTGSVATAWSWKTGGTGGRDFEGYGYDGEDDEGIAGGGGITPSMHGSMKRSRLMEDITPTEETYDVSEEPSPMHEEESLPLEDPYHLIPLPDSPLSSVHLDLPLSEPSMITFSATPTAVTIV